MNNTFRKAAAILFTRIIVLTHLDNGQRSAFRKAEKLTKQPAILAIFSLGTRIA